MKDEENYYNTKVEEIEEYDNTDSNFEFAIYLIILTFVLILFGACIYIGYTFIVSFVKLICYIYII